MTNGHFLLKQKSLTLTGLANMAEFFIVSVLFMGEVRSYANARSVEVSVLENQQLIVQST